MTINRFRNEQQIIDDLRRRHRRAEREANNLPRPSLRAPIRSLQILKRIVTAA